MFERKGFASSSDFLYKCKGVEMFVRLIIGTHFLIENLQHSYERGTMFGTSCTLKIHIEIILLRDCTYKMQRCDFQSMSQLKILMTENLDFKRYLKGML